MPVVIRRKFRQGLCLKYRRIVAVDEELFLIGQLKDGFPELVRHNAFHYGIAYIRLLGDEDVLTLSPKDGRAAALYGIDPYGMSFESTALYIGITSLPEYFAEPFVLLLETADFCQRHKERAPGKFFTC